MKKEANAAEKLIYERELIANGARYIAGVDEVGRGPLAGPVVCAAVIMPLDTALLIGGVDDSKKLSAAKREKLSALIKERAIAYSIAEVPPERIDEINILQATRQGMREALLALKIKPDAVLTDGNMTLDIPFFQRSIVHGDALSYSIGAASIIAKVYRDSLMSELAVTYPAYGFEKNKGYGTAEHIAAIREVGLCSVHRRTFTKKF
ncbi:MAG: ribonuclease HII [Candidatus Borkfalkiaceae bacterium]|nr:ribonuclease HII [Clostridia bacterium]MDY6222587.1 ribonuclease HII [Christensenellaceae bacterium]